MDDKINRLISYLNKLDTEEKIEAINYLLGDTLTTLKDRAYLAEFINFFQNRINKLEKTINILQIAFSLGLLLAFLEIGHLAGWI